MKRVLSLVLALVMVFGTIMPAFAEDAVAIAAASQAATDLVSYGLIAGSDKGLEEDKPLTRQEMAVIYAKMYGKAAEAEAYAFPSSFTDDPANWATPWIAYAEIQGWMVGDGAGATFRPLDYVSVQEINTLMVKALGHEVTWATVNADAAALGVVVEAADETLVLRGEIFATIRGALDLDPKDATETLGTTLALTGYVAPEPPTPAELEVVSVTALNLIQVEVVFNQEVDADSAETAGNYDVEDMTINDAALQADNMTVVLTLSVNAAQQAAKDVTVDGVETADEVALEEVVFEDVAFLDTTIPTAVSAEVVGIDTIKVTFSEPMTTATLVKANFSVDGGDLYINTVTPMNNNTEANITLYSDLEAGDVSVKVKAAVEDEAGFGVIQDTLTATVTEDADAPVVVGFKDATTTGVTLIFNEEIEIASALAANFYHTNSSNPIDQDIVAADLSSDGKELTLDFGNKELPEGTAYVYVLKKSVNDLWDNLNAQIMFKVEITVDVTAPEVDSVKVKTEEQIQVKFTEAVVKADAEDEDNYTILQDGEEVEDIIDDIDFAAKVATINFNDTLSGDYTIVVKNIEDAAENEMATATVEFSVDDLTAPVFTDFTATIYNAGLTNQMIRVTFGESMNADGINSVMDAANYKIGAYQLTDLVDKYDAEMALTDNGKTVQITVPVDVVATTTVVEGVTLADTDDILLARVADAAGNYTVDYSDTIDVVAAATVNIAKVQVTAVDTVVVTFDDLLDEFDASDLIVTTYTNVVPVAADAWAARLPLAKRAISMNSDGNTVVTLTLVTDLTFDALSVATPVYAHVVDVTDAGVASTIGSENEFGEKLAVNDAKLGVDKVAAELYADAIANTVAYEDYLVIGNDNTFTIKFSENLDDTALSFVLFGADFVVKADNDTLTNGVDFEVTDITNDVVTFAFLGDYLGFDGDVTVDRAATTNHVTDVAGNDVDAFESDEFAVTMAPTMASAKTTDAVTVVVTFVENIETAGTFVSADVAAQFTATEEGGLAVAATGASITDNKLTLTFPAATFTTGVDLDDVDYTSAGVAADERIVGVGDAKDLVDGALGDVLTTSGF